VLLISCLRNCRSCGVDGLSKENIVRSHPSLLIHLKLLFNMIFAHGFVPDNFGLGITVPVIKVKLGNINSANNYRPITLTRYGFLSLYLICYNCTIFL